MPETKVICLTPCRNENWIIDIHLNAASQWADHIIVGDQISDDGTRETVRRYPKACLVDNGGDGYDEGERHRVVFEAARLIPGRKILLAIDSDELLSANWIDNGEWEKLMRLPEGTAIYARWANILPGFKTWFAMGGPFVIGYVDDGKISYSPGKFHVPRLAVPPDAPRFVLDGIRLLHFQYADQARSESKNRAYQVQEWALSPHRPVRLFRRFNPMAGIAPAHVHAVLTNWIDGFAQQGIEWRAIHIDGAYRWDPIVVNELISRGTRFFRKLDIWDVDWQELASLHGINTNGRDLRDPRSTLERAVHAFLRRTQPSMEKPIVRMAQQLLRVWGW
jgi:hypothetical protein